MNGNNIERANCTLKKRMYSEWKSRQTGFIIILILMVGLKTINNSENECAESPLFPNLLPHY